MRNRQKQRELKRKQKREAMLETTNSYGYNDPTPYQAVLSIRNSNNHSLSRLPSETKAAFLCPKSAEGGEQDG